MGALDGLLVLDLGGGIAGAVAGMLLSDNGARVIMVKHEGGVPDRLHPGHRVWDRGKESLAADLRDGAGRELFDGLLARADVLLHTYPPARACELGVDHESASRRNARLITCAITGYGSRGPLAGRTCDDALVSARTGLSARQPGWSPGPSHIVPPIPSVAAALLAVQGILAALLAREATDAGQHVETSLLAGVLATTTESCISIGGGDPAGERFRLLDRRPAGPQPFYSAYECADGRWLQLGSSNAHFVRRTAAALGVSAAAPDLLAGPGFGDGSLIPAEETRRALYELAARSIKERSAAEWARILDEADVPMSPVQAPVEFLADPQGRVNGFTEVVDPEVGRIEQIGLTLRLSGTPGRVRGPAPRPGEHTGAATAKIAAVGPASAGDAAAGPVHDTSSERLPLQGIRVLELGNLIAGPLATRFLADLGADVIKLESTDGGDIARRANSPAFHSLNAGKRGIAVNLKLEAGREVGRRLASKADVILNNMRPGVADRLGLGWEQVRAIDPRIIYCQMTAFGTTGPYAHRPGLDALACALTGVELVQGAYAGKPVFVHGAAADHIAALLGCAGILMALYARARGRPGQLVETSLLDAAALLNAHELVRYRDQPSLQIRPRTQYGPDALHRLYETAEGWLCLSVEEESQWLVLCRAFGAPQLIDDERFAAPEVRAENNGPLAALLADALRTRAAVAWIADLEASGVACAPVVDGYSARFFADPQVVANQLAVKIEDAARGAVRFPHRWVQLSGAVVGCRGPVPLLGQHTRDVLAELGYAEERIGALQREGIVSWPQPAAVEV